MLVTIPIPHCSWPVLCLALNCSFKNLPSLATPLLSQWQASHFSQSPHLWVLAVLAFSPLVLQCNYLTAYCLPHLPGLSVLENSWSLHTDKRTNITPCWTPYAPLDAFGKQQHTCIIVHRYEHWKSDNVHIQVFHCNVQHSWSRIPSCSETPIQNCSRIQGQHLQQNEEISAPLWGFTCGCWYLPWFSSYARWNMKSV